MNPPAPPSLEDIIVNISLGVIWAVLGLIAIVVLAHISYDKENRK